MNKKLITIIIAIISIGGYGYLAFALITPGQTLDPVLAGLCTGPNDPACVINQAWQQDINNNLIFNDTTNIAIGIDATDKKFTARDGIFELNLDSVSVFPTNHLYGFLTIPGVGFSTVDTLNEAYIFNGIFDATGVGGDIGIFLNFINPNVEQIIQLDQDRIRISSSNDLLLNSEDRIFVSAGGLLETVSKGFGQAAFVTVNGELSNNPYTYTSLDAGMLLTTELLPDGPIVNAEGAGFLLYTNFDSDQSGFGLNGTVSGISNNIQMRGGGFVDSVISLRNLIVVNSDQQINSIFLTNSALSLQDTTGIGGTIDSIYGNYVALQSQDQRSITDFYGNTVTASQQGIGLIGNTFGFHTTLLEGDNVAAFYVPSGSLFGMSSEYGIYIGDNEAENFFATGVRIGGNLTDYQISSGSLGMASGPLYIGNEQITTSVSDRRLKTNIAPALDSGLDFINSLSVTSFDWLAESKRSEQGRIPFGFIAQEIDTIAPYYVSKTNNPNDIMAVRFGDMVPALTKAIQELDLKIQNIQSASSTVVASSGFSLNSLRTWLGDVGNGIQRIIADRLQARNEICIDDVCMNKEQLRNLLITQNSNTSGSQNNESDQGVQGNQSDVDNDVNSESEEQTDTELPSNLPDQEESLEDNSLQNEQEIVSETPLEDSESTIQE